MGEKAAADLSPTAVNLGLDLGFIEIAAGLEVLDVGVLVGQVDVVEQGAVHQHALLFE